MNLITSDVSRAMLGAASSAAQAGVSMGVYRQAKAKGDEGGMGRAAGYAAGSMRTASQQNQAAREALERAQTEARQQEDLERRQAIEDARSEARQQEKTRQAEEDTPVQAKETDAPRIADAGPAASEASSQSPDGGKVAQSTPAQSVSRRTEDPASTVALYTRLGEIRPAAPEQKLSVTS